MRGLREIPAILAPMLLMAPQAMAQDCDSARLGAYGSRIPTYLLVSMPPVAGETVLVQPGTLATRGLAVARQEFSIAPKLRYLTADIPLTDERGGSLANAVPLTAGSRITFWRGADGERECAIGWRNGLFGGATGDGHYRWVCLEDRDGDGAYDNAWRPRSKNMGLSYSRIDMPISPAVRWTETAPATPAAKTRSQTAAIGTNVAIREIVIRSAYSGTLSFEYRGVGVSRDPSNRAEIRGKEGGSVTLGGVTITATPEGRGMRLTATGVFPAARIAPICGGAAYSIEGFEAQVMFSFPNW
ncbi:hypothetical protein P1X14_11860 [Sphingomonas sp. AOB5]|uniref:hypothetical protein n=1 Tax=Sphingomonas sp. AOB5 TaxID=3034017 RepID=UPI0023F6C4A4|nr:hypothetical protein [Sphingomonas sp. AOB5]MDF7775943.1 hypothetical protein [Sphingomonas sp. AOB5]